MSKLPIRKKNYTTITKMHIAALSLTTIFLSLLTGAIGYQAGKKSIPLPENENTSSMLPNVDKQATLEALLHEIDQAQRQGSDNDYLFPAELLKEEPLPMPAPPPTVDVTTNISPSPEKMELPELPQQSLPTSGWSIQVGSYPNIEEAQSKLATLKEEYPKAYTVTASIEGDTWYRVRIAGYPTKAKAMDKKKSLEVQNQEFDYLVFKTP
jgi:hypothetical protein